MKKPLIFIIFIVLGCSIFVSSSHALTVSPAKVEYSANPGDVISGTITLINTESREATYYPSFESVETQGSWGDPVFTGEVAGLASWIEASPLEVHLSPGERKRTSFTITVPENANAGGNYAAIFWGTSPSEGSGTGSVGISNRIAILVLLNVSGDVIEDGQIKNFQTNKKVFNYFPINFSYILKNDGSVHLKPEGKITIKNIFGSEISVFSANPNKYYALPGAERAYSITLSAENPVDEADAQGFFGKLKKERNSFGFGYYSAVLDIEFGKEGKSAQDSLNFWIFPWRLMLLNSLIVITLLFIIFQGIKRYNDWIIAKAGVSEERIPRKSTRIKKQKEQARRSNNAEE
ncbi:MAG: hypothetical protein CEE43_17140 [Promethearchaeota archaeon Loki_b32]|nr:MAG: hypothetical protein CEE43_17140 [Candidatus Lokiarchaeota archaeon Loki_b32]